MHPGQQHQMPGANYNPFLAPAVTPYSAQQIATLQSKLNKQLGPEYLSQRAGPGGKKVHYIQADKLINLANEVFGFNGWSSSIQNMEVEYLDFKDGKWSIGVTVTVRVMLKDGCFHEDVGWGSMENGKTKAQVFEKAKKEGTTDALKRAMRTFGNVLGLCLNDSDYMARVARIKAAPTQFDETQLHRRSTTQPPTTTLRQTAPPVIPTVKLDPTHNGGSDAVPQSADELGDGVDEFDELGIFAGDDDVFNGLVSEESFADLAPEIETPSKPSTTITNHSTTIANSGPPPQFGRDVHQGPAAHNEIAQLANNPGQQTSGQPLRSNIHPPGNSHYQRRLPGNRPNLSPTPTVTPNRPHETAASVPDAKSNETPPPGDNQNSKPNPPQPSNVTVGFFTGRAALNLDGNTVLNPGTLPPFDPRRPTTIPRSAGIDHSKSSPIPRKVVQPNPVPRPNFENPSGSSMRQIGLPPGRSPYRPPTMAPPNVNSGVKRGPEQVDPSPQKSNTQPELAYHVLTEQQQQQ